MIAKPNKIKPSPFKNQLFYGDNLDILRDKIAPETVDLCYIDPPFNSKRNYSQIYNNIGTDGDKAQSQAFMDTWEWGEEAIQGLAYITDIQHLNSGKFTPQTVALIKGLEQVLGRGSLLAYLVHMTLRIIEIRRVLKPTGTFYLHCDPTASHYLKLVCDSVFCADGNGGDFRNELIWAYDSAGRGTKDFNRKHDVIFRYVKSKESWVFNGKADGVGTIRQATNHMKIGKDSEGRLYYQKVDKASGKTYRWYLDDSKISNDWWEELQESGSELDDYFFVNALNREDKERLGYPTQKPEVLLERIIKASSNVGDVVLEV